MPINYYLKDPCFFHSDRTSPAILSTLNLDAYVTMPGKDDQKHTWGNTKSCPSSSSAFFFMNETIFSLSLLLKIKEKRLNEMRGKWKVEKKAASRKTQKGNNKRMQDKKEERKERKGKKIKSARRLQC